MGNTGSSLLAQLSEALASQVAAAAPWVTAIRVGGNRHIAGIVWRSELVVTSDQALPAQDSYSLAVSSGKLLPAHTVRRDPATNLVCLSLDTPAETEALRAAVNPSVGGLALAIGAAADGSPTVRLGAIHQISPNHADGGGPLSGAITLDLPAGTVPEGGPVLDAKGGILGMATAGRQGEALVVPHATIVRFLDPLALPAKTLATATQARRGWLGVALQPISVPGTLRMIAGQSSARMVVSVSPGGPADQAGLRVGDVLLAIDGQSVSGQQGLRGIINADRIGAAIEVRLLREGAVRRAVLTIADQPLDRSA